MDVSIETDIPLEISYPVDVLGATITKRDSNDLSFGYGKRVTPNKRPSIMLTPGQPLQIRVNVFEYDDDFSDFSPDEYLCEIKVLVEVKDAIKNQMLELRDSLVIDVS